MEKVASFDGLDDAARALVPRVAQFVRDAPAGMWSVLSLVSFGSSRRVDFSCPQSLCFCRREVRPVDRPSSRSLAARLSTSASRVGSVFARRRIATISLRRLATWDLEIMVRDNVRGRLLFPPACFRCRIFFARCSTIPSALESLPETSALMASFRGVFRKACGFRSGDFFICDWWVAPVATLSGNVSSCLTLFEIVFSPARQKHARGGLAYPRFESASVHQP